MLDTIGTWIGIFGGVVVIVGVIVAAAKGGFGIFSRINKIDELCRSTNALLLIHRNELFELYRDNIKIVFNPTPSPYSDDEKYALLEKMKQGFINHIEAARLTEILKFEEETARQKDKQTAVLAIAALILLVALLAKD
jgi:hypothetical protein